MPPRAVLLVEEVEVGDVLAVVGKPRQVILAVSVVEPPRQRGEQPAWVLHERVEAPLVAHTALQRVEAVRPAEYALMRRVQPRAQRLRQRPQPQHTPQERETPWGIAVALAYDVAVNGAF